ncbi:hypothetical protein LTR17_018274 [Elasticomyces elasticus]|nr:hypothetical protein LTR17_018274 [Elasticomyces elasticus]
MDCSALARPNDLEAYITLLADGTYGDPTQLQHCKQQACTALWGDVNADTFGEIMLVVNVLEQAVGLILAVVVIIAGYRYKEESKAGSLCSVARRALSSFDIYATLSAFYIQFAAAAELAKQNSKINTLGMGNATVHIPQAVSLLVLLPLGYNMLVTGFGYRWPWDHDLPRVTVTEGKGLVIGRVVRSDSSIDDPHSLFFIACWLLAYYPKILGSIRTGPSGAAIMEITNLAIIEDLCTKGIRQLTKNETALMDAFEILAYVSISTLVLGRMLWLVLQKYHFESRLYVALQYWSEKCVSPRLETALRTACLALIPLLASGLLWTVFRTQQLQVDMTRVLASDCVEHRSTFGLVVTLSLLVTTLGGAWRLYMWQRAPRPRALMTRESLMGLLHPLHHRLGSTEKATVQSQRVLRRPGDTVRRYSYGSLLDVSFDVDVSREPLVAFKEMRLSTDEGPTPPDLDRAQKFKMLSHQPPPRDLVARMTISIWVLAALKLLSQVRSWTLLSVARFLRPSVRRGFTRITWRCVSPPSIFCRSCANIFVEHCGTELYADYHDTSTTEVAALSRELNRPYTTAAPASGTASQDSGATPPTPPAATHQSNANNQSHSSSAAPGQNASSHGPTINITPARRASDPTQTLLPRYLELCVNTGRLCQSLGEIDATRITSDAELFRWVRRRYRDLRGWRMRSRFCLRPKSIRFVRFGLEQQKKVHILCEKESFPSESDVKARTYHYMPCPMSPLGSPPMPSDAFIHYLHDCNLDGDDASRRSIWLNRLPKKLEESVVAQARSAGDQTLVEGWGVHVIEGIDGAAVLWTTIVALLVGIGPLLGSYIALTGDVQSATGIASLIVAIIAILMICMQIEIGRST